MKLIFCLEWNGYFNKQILLVPALSLRCFIEVESLENYHPD